MLKKYTISTYKFLKTLTLYHFHRKKWKVPTWNKKKEKIIVSYKTNEKQKLITTAMLIVNTNRSFKKWNINKRNRSEETSVCTLIDTQSNDSYVYVNR